MKEQLAIAKEKGEGKQEKVPRTANHQRQKHRVRSHRL